MADTGAGGPGINAEHKKALEAYARFLIGSFMYVKRTNKRGVVINKEGKPILNADPNRIPQFKNTNPTNKEWKETDFQTLMTNTHIWTRYSHPFRKGGDDINSVYRALWLHPTVEFEPLVSSNVPLKHTMILYEAMPFSTTYSFQSAVNYLSSGAPRIPGAIPYIFRFTLKPDSDAYIDALKQYHEHKRIFNNAGFTAEEQLQDQKEITLYPGAFFITSITEKIYTMKDVPITVKVIDVQRKQPAWILRPSSGGSGGIGGSSSGGGNTSRFKRSGRSENTKRKRSGLQRKTRAQRKKYTRRRYR